MRNHEAPPGGQPDQRARLSSAARHDPEVELETTVAEHREITWQRRRSVITFESYQRARHRWTERSVDDLLEDAEWLRAHQLSPVHVKRRPAPGAGELRDPIVVLHRRELCMRLPARAECRTVKTQLPGKPISVALTSLSRSDWGKWSLAHAPRSPRHKHRRQPTKCDTDSKE